MTDVLEETVWPEATERLRGDPAFAPLVDEVGPVRLRAPEETYFHALARAIVYQQLAGAAARTIHGRVLEVLGGDATPGAILAASEEDPRGAGLSRAKHAAIVDLATKVDRGEVGLDDLNGVDDAGVKERLTRVRGIGPWTADMFLLFTLRRPDVWPVGDLGVRQGMGLVLGWDDAPTAKQLDLMGVGYRPWRSAVAWYCWRAVDTLTPDAS